MNSKDKLLVQKDKQIVELRALVAALTKRVAELELALAKANKDSSTSSKPPSSHIAKTEPTMKPGPPKNSVNRCRPSVLTKSSTTKSPITISSVWD